jgi:hypothetical protein
MHRQLITASLALSLAAAGGTDVAAGPLKRDWVAADATWLIHVDVEQVNDTNLGRFLLAHSEDFDIELDDIQEETGLDPRKDILNITAYGDTDPDDNVIVVATMTDRIDEVLEMARHDEHYFKVVVDIYTVHAWSDGDETIYAYITEGSRDDERTVVVAGETSLVRKGIRVVEDEADSIADDKDAKLTGKPGPGSLIFVAASGLPWLEDDDEPASAILKQSDHVMLNLAENDDTASIKVNVHAKTSENATSIAEMLTGLVAFGRMMAQSDPELAPLLELAKGIRISDEGRHVSVTVEAPSAMLIHSLHEIADDDEDDDDDDDH